MKEELIKKFTVMLDDMTDEEMQRLNNHFSDVSGAVFRFIVNAYPADRAIWIKAATAELMMYTDDADFSEGHAENLWDSVGFRLEPDDAVESVSDEVSYWDE